MADEEQFYRVALSANHSACTQCGHGSYYTVVYTDRFGEEVEIGTSWGDSEVAEDVCDLMNMAFDAGVESERSLENEVKEALR
jgi:hypothetical protein